MDLAKIKRIAFDEMAQKVHWCGEKSGKYYHGERTAKLALTLREYVLPGDGSHDDILTVAAWLHDIASGESDHPLKGAERAKILLAGHCTEREIREIYDIMYRHDERQSVSDADRDEFSVYAKIQQDADFLDHLGTLNIFTNFVHLALTGKTVVDEIDRMKEWLIRLETEFEVELNFDISKRIYRDRVAFYRSFLERFAVEGAGEIWGEGIILKHKDDLDG